MRKIPIYIITLIILLFSASGTLSAQQDNKSEYLFEFRGESMVDALHHIANETDIDLVFDPVIVRNINVYKRLQHTTVQGLLTDLLKDYRLDYITLSSGTVVIVRSPRETPAYGTLAGKIVDAQTGDPLPGATILLADASGGTSSNRGGYFSINRVMSGSHQIIISYMGYESAFKTVDIKPDQHVSERIALTPKQIDVSPLVVEAHRPRMPSTNSGAEIHPDNNLNTSAMIHSPIRNLNLVPGIQHGLPMQDLHLQGSHQGEHRMLLDGVPVYNPYSFGRLFSSFSPFAIGSVKLHKAGYGVQEGSHLAGLVNLSNDLSYSDRNSALFQADPLSLNLRSDLAIPLKNDQAIHTMAAVRSSYWGFYRNPVLDQMLLEWDLIDPLIANRVLDLEHDAGMYTPALHDSEVRFLDFHFAAGYEPDAFSTVSASLYMAENLIETRVLNQTVADAERPRFLYSSDLHNWTNLVGQVQWTRMVTPRFDLSMQGAYSENRFNHGNSVGLAEISPFKNFRGESLFSSAPASDSSIGAVYPLPAKIDGNRIRHLLVGVDASYSISPAYSIDAGLQADRVYSEVNISDFTYLDTHTSQASTLLSSYLNSNHSFNRRWKLDYGSRFTFLNTTGQVYAEPRFSIQYDQPDAEIGYWSARLAGGLYRQFVNEFRITNTGATSIVPDVTIWSHADDSAIPKAYHLTGSLLLEPTDQTTVSVEGFYKWQPVTNITSYGNLIEGEELDRSEIGAFARTTEMTVLGAGFRLNHEINDSKIRLLAGYDYSYSRIDLSEQFGRTIAPPWHEPHRAQLRTLYRAFPEFTIVAKWQGIWGRAWAYRQSYYNYLRSFDPQSNEIPSFDNPENDTLTPFQQVDLSFIYQPGFGSADMEIRLELINLLNRRNSIEKFEMPVFTDGEVTGYSTRNRLLPGFYPSVSIQVKI